MIINYLKLIAIDVLFSLVHIVNIIIQGDSKDLSLVPLVLWDLLLCLIYMSIHGVATYLVYRRIFYPHLITGIIILISTVYLLVCPYGDKQWILGSSMFLCGFFIVSLIGSLVTLFVCKIYAKKQCNVKNVHKKDFNY